MASCSAQPSARSLDRAPMSERQQLALIKQMERSSTLTAAAGTGNPNSPVVAPMPSATATSPTTNDCSQVSSPPRTPLQVVNGHHNRLQMLAGQPASPAVNSPTVSTNQPTPAEDKLRKRLTRKNEKGETPLHRAAIRGSKKVAKKILMLGVEPNVADNAGWTPLHEACNHGNLSVARLLVKHGADVNLYGGVGEQRQTALHDAARNGHFEVVRFLIKKGANIAAKKENGRTPLDEAKSSTADNPDLADVIQFLTEHQENGGSFSDSDSSSDDSEDDSDRDLAKFLGLSSSPSVEKFLQKIGLGTASEPASPVQHLQLTDSERKKPPRKTQRQRDASTRRSDKSSGVCESSSKIRLSFNMEGVTSREDVGLSKSASSCPASRTSSPVSSVSSRAVAPAPAVTATDKSEDPYEFKTSSCDEPALLSLSGDKCKEPLLKDEKKAAEKRAINGEEVVDEDAKKRKRKEEKESKSGRGVKANLSGKPAIKGRNMLLERNSPLPVSGSAANSPRRKSLGGQSDSEEDPSRKITPPNMPKVPPLKIVLSGTANMGGNGQQDSERRPGGRGSRDESSIVAVDELGASDVGGDSKASSSSRMTRSRANHGPSGTDSCEQGPATDPSPGAPLDPVPILDAPAPTPNAGPPAITSFTSSFSDYHLKKRKLRSQLENVDNSNSPAASSNSTLSTAAAGGLSATKSCLVAAADGTYSVTTIPATSIEPLNDIQKYLNIRRQVEQRRKNLFPVQPKPPQGFKDYLMNRKTYLLQGNQERLRSIPLAAPPASLEGPLRDLFVEQEKQRHDLRKKHQVEKEKLVLAVEQEILRVHGRAARALANQSLPYSVCTILKDEEIYAPIDLSQEEKNRDIRSRYNGRLFLSWLQDVDDKWEKIKEQMVLRHHNEAESLNAVQKMDWEWKVNDHYVNVNPRLLPPMDELHIPMVHVSDDFDLSDAK